MCECGIAKPCASKLCRFRFSAPGTGVELLGGDRLAVQLGHFEWERAFCKGTVFGRGQAPKKHTGSHMQVRISHRGDNKIDTLLRGHQPPS